jgi:hypothetical protein
MSCAVPPELAIIMGEWRGEDIYFKLDEYGTVECNDQVYEDTLYGVIGFRDSFMGGEPDVDGKEVLSCYIGRLTEGDEGGNQVPDVYYNYTVRKIEPIVDPFFYWLEVYYFNLCGIDEVEGVAMSSYQMIDENGMTVMGDLIWPFEANRARR